MSYARHVCFFTHEDFCAYPALVQHISVAIAGARGDPTSVAHAAEVHDLAAICHAVASRATRAITSAHTACINYISSAVALARGDARAAAEAAFVDCITIAVALARWKARPIAHPADVNHLPAVGLAVTANGHLNDGLSSRAVIARCGCQNSVSIQHICV
jgi:hypothetical protein